MNPFYITTPIYYINAKPHIGSAYTTIAADVLARYHRLLGQEVFFLTGTDENSQKNLEAAEKNGKGNQMQTYLDEMADVWQRTFNALNITHTRFIRTTEPDHSKAVETFWKRVLAKGDIYLGDYNGLYCTGCEAFLQESDLTEDGLCPDHQKPPKKIVEKNYFFKVTNYKAALLKHIQEHPDFIMPESRRHEVIQYIEHFMTDLSISRSTMQWGIPVPGDASQRIYVWFDALINYLTGIGFATDEQSFQKWWPHVHHLVGKDIIKFHCALWPAMLLSADLPLPKRVFAHGFFTVDGQKMSKSLGNVMDPLQLVKEYSNDVLRYFLLAEIRFGEDGDFSKERLSERYEKELANELGNLVSRSLAMTETYLDGMVPQVITESFLGMVWQDYNHAMEMFAFQEALESVWKLVRKANQFVEEQKPWQQAKEQDKTLLKKTLYTLLETLWHLSFLLYPFLPQTSELIFKQLGKEIKDVFSLPLDKFSVWGNLQPGDRVYKGEILFPKK